MAKSKWQSVKIHAEQFERIKALCDRSGQSVQFHVLRALHDYIADELPVWERKFQGVEKDIREAR